MVEKKNFLKREINRSRSLFFWKKTLKESVRIKDNELNLFLFSLLFYLLFYFILILFSKLRVGVSIISHITVTNCHISHNTVTSHSHMIIYY